MSGHVDDPVPAGRLLLVMTLVLAGGIGVIDHRSANAAIIDIVIAPRPCGSLAVKRSDCGPTMVDPVALMAHVHHVRDPDLAVVDLPVALLGNPLLLATAVGRGVIAARALRIAGILLGLEESPLLSDFEESEDLLSSFLESSDFWSLPSDSFFSSVLAPEACAAFSSLGFFLSLFFTAVAALSAEPLPCFATLAHPS